MSLYQTAQFAMSVATLQGLPPPGLPEIAFAGRSNAGKSTAINVLTRHGGLAFSSKTPGRTQLLNFFTLTERGSTPGERIPVASLVDLPGYGFAKAQASTRATWGELVGGYLSERENLAGLVIVMDSRHPFMPTDEWVIGAMQQRRCPLHLLLNKSDQLKTAEKNAVMRLALGRARQIGPHVTVQLFSGLKKQGAEELEQILDGWLNKGGASR